MLITRRKAPLEDRREASAEKSKSVKVKEVNGRSIEVCMRLH